MPSGLISMFEAKATVGTARQRTNGLRMLHAVLGQDSPRRRFRLMTRLLARKPFSLALVAEVRREQPDCPVAEILCAGGAGSRSGLLSEHLGGQLSPLRGAGTGRPRWISLAEDPFGPGTAFVRAMGLAWALVLPLEGAESASATVRYLLLAARKARASDDAIIQDVLAAWSIYRSATSARRGDGCGPTEAEQVEGWPGRAAWLKAPVALAIVGGDEIQAINRTAGDLLDRNVGKGAGTWRLWLAAVVRRLETAGRLSERLAVCPGRPQTLEVTLGPPLPGGDRRVVAIRDATAEVRADSQRTEAISTLSHELRTPLTSMKNSVALVLRGEAGGLTPHQQRFMALTMKNIDRLERLINDLLDVSRAAAGRLSLRRQVVDMGALLREAVEMLAPTGRQREITIDVSGVPASYVAHVDGDKVVQMVHNMVGNALKYTEPGGYVRISLQERPESLPELAKILAERFLLPLRTFLLTVQDNGMGMSEEIQHDLFHPFRRGREAEASRAPGSGLGLHITRALVEAHGGSIALRSRLNIGTTVEILLPRDPESERLLRAALCLQRSLAATKGARLACLDARRPQRAPGPQELLRARQAVVCFLARLTEDGESPTGPRPAPDMGLWPPTSEPPPTGAAVEELDVGLWAALMDDPARLDPAWDILKTQLECPSLLAGTSWQCVPVPPYPDGPDAPAQGADDDGDARALAFPSGKEP